MVEHVHRVTELHDPEHPAESASIVAARLINLVIGIIIAFIVLRMILLLFGANQGNALVDLIYGISAVFVAPFYGMFGNTPTFGASVFDVSSLVAIIAYALIGWGLVALTTIGLRDRTEV
jgi:hypothetical protein